MENKDTIYICDRTKKGVNYNITIHEMIEILLTIENLIFLTKHQQFHYVDDIDLKRQIFQFHVNFTLKSSPALLSNRLVWLNQ